jgi:NAD(P)H-nitrite reductase large subunit
MQPDDEICLCFHVTLRKVQNWIRVNKPSRPGQISECFGAGTGCGWCRPWLTRLLENSQCSQAESPKTIAADFPEASEYSKSREARNELEKKNRPIPPGQLPPSEDN